MKQGFIKVCAGTPDLRVADCEYNADRILQLIGQIKDAQAKIMVFPELCITGYTCGDLFWQERLLEEAKEQLLRLAQETKNTDALIFLGLPLEYESKLYNVAAVISRGKILGFVPKIFIPNYNEYYEARYCTSGRDVQGTVDLNRQKIGFGTRRIFVCRQMSQ